MALSLEYRLKLMTVKTKGTMRIPATNPSKLRKTKVVRRQVAEEPAWPRWLGETARDCQQGQVASAAREVNLLWFDSPRHSVVRATIPEAAKLDDVNFRQAVIAAYREVVATLRRSSARHIARIWNYIPDIHRPCDGGLDRYMVFNAGRFEACQQWLGETFERKLPTATGIGHQGRDLIIDALAVNVEGIAIENPRQVSAYQYSPRYGPRPPCFARATMVGLDRLFVGGTASVLGEESVHETDLMAQINETLANLTGLLKHAAGSRSASYSDLRVYHRALGDRELIGNAVRDWAGEATRIEFMQAEPCRRELLVEIEGVAVID
jgi:chorismate lyase / 3-hydroxybenzoate synthase